MDAINLAKIIEFPGVASRAAETIVLLAGSLVATLMLLVPQDSRAVAGVMVLAIVIPMAFGPAIVQLAQLHKGTYYKLRLAWARITLHRISTLPFVLAGLSLLGVIPGGLLWFALGVALGITLGKASGSAFREPSIAKVGAGSHSSAGLNRLLKGLRGFEEKPGRNSRQLVSRFNGSSPPNDDNSALVCTIFRGPTWRIATADLLAH